MGERGKVVHIAGLDVQIGPLLRQRCAWCDAVLIDYDLRNVMTKVGTNESEPPRPATWAVGSLVEVDGHYSASLEHADGDNLPMHACVPLLVAAEEKP